MKSWLAWTIFRADGSPCVDCTASTQHLAITRCVGQETGFRKRWNRVVRDGQYNIRQVRIAILQVCRVCGCTEDHSCPGGCYWVGPDICSACARKEERKKS